MKKTNARGFLTGFTIIELLVVVAIIGLLSSIISFAVGQSRLRARDTKRVTDMKQIKSGLDLYFTSGSGYPDTVTWSAAEGTQLACGETTVLTVPRDPSFPVYAYGYTASGSSQTGCGTTVRAAYQIRFFIENRSGYYRMNEDGNLTDDAGNPVSFDDLI